MNKKLLSKAAFERNEEAIKLLDSKKINQKHIIKSIISCVLSDGEKADVGTLLWALIKSKKWNGKCGKKIIATLAVCGNYEVRCHCMQLLEMI